MQYQFKKKKSNIFSLPVEYTAQWEKDESCASKWQQKQANYVELNHFSTV